MARNSTRGSFRGNNHSSGGRGNPSDGGNNPLSRGRGNPSSGGRGSHSNGGRGSHSNGSRGNPSNGGRGSHSNEGRGDIGRNGATNSCSASMDARASMNVDLPLDSRSPDGTNDNGCPIGLSDDAEIASSHVPRGSNTMDQVPTHSSDRIVVELLGADFADVKVTRQIVAIFKNMFQGSWIKWTDVPKGHRDKLWEHFEKQYQWEPEIHNRVYKAWKDVMKSRYPDIMSYARADAIKEAEEANVVVGNNFALLKPFKPIWINQEYWDTMIDKKWNTPQWKNKSKKNKKNKNTLKDGVLQKHTGGSIKMSQTRRQLEKELGRPPTYVELYTRCRTKKGSRLTGNPEFITPTAKKDLDNYLEYMTEKFGPDVSTHPVGDLEAWERAVGGVKKGMIKGATSDPEFIITGIPSTQSASQFSSSRPAPASVEEVERLKQQVSSLLEERTQEREAAAAREQVLLKRMAAIEQMCARMAPPTTQ